MSNKLETAVTTPRFRNSFPSIFTPKYNTLAKKEEFSLQAIFEKGADLSKLRKAAENAMINLFGADKTKWPKDLQNPFKSQKDLIERAKLKGMPFDHLDPDAIYMTFKTGALDKNGAKKPHPVVVGKNPKEVIEEPSKFYAGCWAKANVNAGAYSKGKNNGVTFYLNACQFVGDAAPFSARQNPETAFEAIPEDDLVSSSGGTNDASSMFG